MYFVETMAAIFVLCKTTISALYYACTSVACPLNDAASYEVNEETMEREKKIISIFTMSLCEAIKSTTLSSSSSANSL